MARLGLRRRRSTEVREERVAAAPRPRPFWPWLPEGRRAGPFRFHVRLFVGRLS